MVDDGEGNDCTKAAIMQSYRELGGLEAIGICSVDLWVNNFLMWMGLLPA